MIPRFVEWGHWGISFWLGEREEHPDLEERRRQRRAGERIAFAFLPFGVGATGPVDGCIGSPTRERYRAICRAWTTDGELPEGARCDVTAAWLYDPECPPAIWRDGVGWVSPRRVGHAWIFPEAA